MDLKHTLAKIVSGSLILFAAYQTLISFYSIFFIYPKLNTFNQKNYLIQEGLIEKALIIYFSMVVSGLYGVILLFKPSSKLNFNHFGAKLTQ